MTAKPRAKPLRVTIVSDNEGTLQGLQSYFVESGVPTDGTRVLRALQNSLTAATTAVVLFPDDFDERAVATALASLRRARPRVLLVLITRDARKFDAALASEDQTSLAPIVLPKPSFGWSILDAIRAHAGAS